MSQSVCYAIRGTFRRKCLHSTGRWASNAPQDLQLCALDVKSTRHFCHACRSTHASNAIDSSSCVFKSDFKTSQVSGSETESSVSQLSGLTTAGWIRSGHSLTAPSSASSDGSKRATLLCGSSATFTCGPAVSHMTKRAILSRRISTSAAVRKSASTANPDYPIDPILTTLIDPSILGRLQRHFPGIHRLTDAQQVILRRILSDPRSDRSPRSGKLSSQKSGHVQAGFAKNLATLDSIPLDTFIKDSTGRGK